MYLPLFTLWRYLCDQKSIAIKESKATRTAPPHENRLLILIIVPPFAFSVPVRYFTSAIKFLRAYLIE